MQLVDLIQIQQKNKGFKDILSYAATMLFILGKHTAWKDTVVILPLVKPSDAHTLLNIREFTQWKEVREKEEKLEAGIY